MKYKLGDAHDFDKMFSQEEIKSINNLLFMLKNRLNYKEVDCNIYKTDELVTFLIQSLSMLNGSIPEQYRFSFSDKKKSETYADILICGAAMYALASKSIIERKSEFKISDNGITYTPPLVSDVLNSQYMFESNLWFQKRNSLVF